MPHWLSRKLLWWGTGTTSVDIPPLLSPLVFCPRLISEYVFRLNFGCFCIQIKLVLRLDFHAIKCTYLYYPVCFDMYMYVMYTDPPITPEDSFRYTAFNFYPSSLAKGTYILVSISIDNFCVLVDFTWDILCVASFTQALFLIFFPGAVLICILAPFSCWVVLYAIGRLRSGDLFPCRWTCESFPVPAMMNTVHEHFCTSVCMDIHFCGF